jgi:Right handed beta helix region
MMSPPARKTRFSNRAVGSAIAGVSVLAVALAGASLLSKDSPAPAPAASPAPVTGPRVCGQPVLDSPFSYAGAPGRYKSGTPGLPTYGKPHSDFPRATGGVVVPAGTRDFLAYQLKPHTVYYLLPGKHVGGIQANAGDVFVGGLADGVRTVLTGNYTSGGQAIDSNASNGDTRDVTIEYLTIEKYRPDNDAAAINQEANTGWDLRYNTITLNVPGAGVMAGSHNTLKNNCLTLNGQYGFQSSNTNGFGADPLTRGPHDVIIEGNEISYNDTCDFSGLLNNAAAGWKKHNPVPASYRNPRCGKVVPNGNQGGFKLWETNRVSVKGNYIHDNWGPGAWADTNNANTTYTGNKFIHNEGAAIIEEISYNFSITNNLIVDNDWADGINNNSFPQPAIFISESGSDGKFGGVPGQYSRQSVISGNLLIDNGGSIFLWQNSNRYCSDGFDGVCTLVRSRSGPFAVDACKANLPSASVDTTGYLGRKTGSPAKDWWNGCLWRTENVSITHNTIDFNPSNIPNCNTTAWPACGAGGIFSEYGSPPNQMPGWVIPTQITFFQGNVWSHNVYNGPSTFWAWNQGNGDNPVSWANWTGDVSQGDKCSSVGEQHSGYCTGPFQQDAGSSYNSFPVSTPMPSASSARASGTPVPSASPTR